MDVTKEDKEKVKAVLQKAVEYYNSISCQCAFPRYHHYVSIDFLDFTIGPFFCYETEALIDLSIDCFEKNKIDTQTGVREIWKCKKCGSTYCFEWEDFNIHISRSFLKIDSKKCKDMGLPIDDNLPVIIGTIGYGEPKHGFRKVDSEEFENYLLEK